MGYKFTRIFPLTDTNEYLLRTKIIYYLTVELKKNFETINYQDF